MEHRGQLVFLFLILAQAAHSIEEYVSKFVRGLRSGSFREQPRQQRSRPGLRGRQHGSCRVRSVVLGCSRAGWRAARGLMWFWTILELLNGISHSAIALSLGGYFPGVVTAPLLLLFAGWLAIIQVKGR